jgi:hypothetical protein
MIAGSFAALGVLRARGVRALVPPRTEFALRFGPDALTASIWPLLFVGLLSIATIELWKTHHAGRWSGRWVAWLAFVFGICLLLVENICSAPALTLLAVAYPSLVLLAPRRQELISEMCEQSIETDADGETAQPIQTVMVSRPSTEDVERTARQRM